MAHQRFTESVLQNTCSSPEEAILAEMLGHEPCELCGASVPKTHDYCTECGRSPDGEVSKVVPIRCSDAVHEQFSGLSFCPNCGIHLDPLVWRRTITEEIVYELLCDGSVIASVVIGYKQCEITLSDGFAAGNFWEAVFEESGMLEHTRDLLDAFRPKFMVLDPGHYIFVYKT